jgi:hypothetical protein
MLFTNPRPIPLDAPAEMGTAAYSFSIMHYKLKVEPVINTLRNFSFSLDNIVLASAEVKTRYL